MNQTEQVTSVTGADIDAAVRDERITGLERRMEMVIRSIVAIETVEALDRRIEQLETCATLNLPALRQAGAETIGNIAELRRIVAEQGEHIENLEGSRRVLQHKLLKFGGGATYTAEHAKQIEDWGSGSR